VLHPPRIAVAERARGLLPAVWGRSAP
jgi:hypothetical protein